MKNTVQGEVCTRRINLIIVHCAATPEGRDIGASEIRHWHLKRGFRDIGYHYVIRLDGTVEAGRALGVAGAHCRGHNSDSVGVCYVGGCDRDMKPKDTRTQAQREALRRLLTDLKRRFPHARITGHREFAAKACPSFDAATEYSDI